MTQIIIRVILFGVLIIASASCNDKISMGELPSKTVEQLKGMLRDSLQYNLKAECKSRLRTNALFQLYTRTNQDNPVMLNITRPTELDATKKLVVLIHGWLSSPNTDGIVKMKDAYLNRYDCNVLVVDWSKTALLSYTTSYCYVPPLAQYIAKALCHLKQHANVPLDKVHVVGHSMGAHIAGWIGKFIATKCKTKLSRITGLDPSGLLFTDDPESKRLDKTDASFVDVIYTDSDGFGSIFKFGHANFYPNCGQSQPGCDSIKNVTDNTSLSDVFCSHHRSLEYMAESINSNNAIAASCGLCPRYCRTEIVNELYKVMGEDCRPDNRLLNNYLIHTRSSSPYFEGWSSYPGVSHKLI